MERMGGMGRRLEEPNKLKRQRAGQAAAGRDRASHLAALARRRGRAAGEAGGFGTIDAPPPRAPPAMYRSSLLRLAVLLVCAGLSACSNRTSDPRGALRGVAAPQDALAAHRAWWSAYTTGDLAALE